MGGWDAYRNGINFGRVIIRKWGVRYNGPKYAMANLPYCIGENSYNEFYYRDDAAFSLFMLWKTANVQPSP